MRKVQNCIVGAGLTCVVLAERIVSPLHEEVLDRRSYIGGNKRVWSY